MKRFILSLVAVIVIGSAIAQQLPSKTYPKTIQVTGVSELEIVPDEIHIAVILKEYQKKGKEKVSIESIRKKFLQNVEKAGIPDSLIQVISYDGSGAVQLWKKKPVEEVLLSSIAYEIIFSEPSDVEAFINLLDQDATEEFTLVETTHSQIKTLQKKLRIDALKAAREKAEYLSAAIAEKIGSAITINENSTPEPYVYKSALANTLNGLIGLDTEAIPGFRKIKLRSEINVVFELL